MGHYNADFTTFTQYKGFLIDFPPNFTPTGVWPGIFQGHHYEQGLTKATFSTQLSRRYMHAVIARSFAGTADSIGVVGQQEF